MYKIKRLKVLSSEGKSDVSLLFNDHHSVPVMYGLLYFSERLIYKAPSTQYASFQGLKLFYNFWYTKFGKSFCRSFYQSGHNPEDAVREFGCFYEELRRSRLNVDDRKSVSHQTAKLRAYAVAQFLEYLVSKYVSHYYSNEPSQSLNEKRKDLILKVKNYQSLIKSEQRYGSLTSSKNIFKSLTNGMVSVLYCIIQPDTKEKKNKLNPFGRKDIQLRNFLIIRLLLNYGLRIGELLLLETSSLKTNISGTSHNLIISNLSDSEQDTRRVRPRIKNSQSIRIIEIEKSDYEFLSAYINSIRPSASEHQLIFSSHNAPYSPLTYESVRAIFKAIDSVISLHYPDFKNPNYVDSIDSLTPHITRHTWAAMTLNSLYNEIQSDRLAEHFNLKIGPIMDEAKEKLRTMGGWSLNSRMPDLYAKRFLSEQANKSNIKRIQDDNHFRLNFDGLE